MRYRRCPDGRNVSKTPSERKPRPYRWGGRPSQQPRCQCRRRSGASFGVTTKWPSPSGISRLHLGHR